MPDRYDQASPAGCGPGVASRLAALSHALRTVVPTGTETDGMLAPRPARPSRRGPRARRDRGQRDDAPSRSSQHRGLDR